MQRVSVVKTLLGKVFIIASIQGLQKVITPIMYKISHSKSAIIYWNSSDQAEEYIRGNAMCADMIVLELSEQIFSSVCETFGKEMQISLIDYSTITENMQGN